MEYTTIFSSLDRTEISIVKHLFEDNNIDHHILGETTNDAAGIAGSGNTGIRVQVPSDQFDRAKSVLVENGFLGKKKSKKAPIHRRPAEKGNIESSRIEIGKRRKTQSIPKWILFVLAAMVLIIVAFLVMYFMNPDA